MNEEILVELFEINSRLESIAWIFLGILVVLGFGLFVRLYDLWKARGNAIFRNVMENYYNAGEFNVVVTGCEGKIKIHKNDGWAYWWKGKAHIKMGELDEAREAFAHLYNLEPGWRPSVQSYLHFIDQNLSKEFNE
ncbi:MAG: tetratricopeptide repeat protein [Verrucomicrobia bacterium]|nr:tetratricopeptide repeat protein [Verrucomicrobiota bacterium]MCH8513989.1 tetratricopeptide repeat protein [Kiritimatiellia bacterium]